jgi:hypothetical protein
MEDKIDLSAILNALYEEDTNFDIDCPGAYEQAVHTAKELARRAVKQALILASEKAELEEVCEHYEGPRGHRSLIVDGRQDLGYEYTTSGMGGMLVSIRVKKDSILSVSQLIV